MKEAFFMIKPEAFHQRNLIKSYLLSFGIEISQAKILKLSKEDIAGIYLDSTSLLLKAQLCFLIDQNVEVGIVTGNNIFESMADICGRSFKPSQCASGTIRRIFGYEHPLIYRDFEFFLNAIHYSTQVEVSSQINWYRHRFQAFSSYVRNA